MKVHSKHPYTQDDINKIVLKSKAQLYKIILDKNKRPNRIAINLYWDEYRSWHNTKETIDASGNIVRINKLDQSSIRTSNSYLAERYNCSVPSIRRANRCLEELGLISRHFKNKKDYQVQSFNQLNIFVWKDTPHFFNPYGIFHSEIKTINRCTNHKNTTPSTGKKDDITQSSMIVPPIIHDRTNILRTGLREVNSFSKEKEFTSSPKIKNKRVKPQTKPSADLLSFPNGAANHADQHVKVTEQIPIPEQQPINEHQEDKPVGAYNWEDPKIKLDLAISRNFDIATATMLTVDIDYRYHTAENVISLVPKQKLAISEEHKGRLRQIIKEVYGEEVRITQPNPGAKKDDVAKKAHNQEKILSTEQKPPEISDFSDKPLTQKVIKNLVDDGIDKALINSWLNSVRVKIIEYENQIIFECSDFTAEQIINRFMSGLMQSCKEFGLEIILLAKDRLDEVREIKITEKGKW